MKRKQKSPKIFFFFCHIRIKRMMKLRALNGFHGPFASLISRDVLVEEIPNFHSFASEELCGYFFVRFGLGPILRLSSDCSMNASITSLIGSNFFRQRDISGFIRFHGVFKFQISRRELLRNRIEHFPRKSRGV